MQLNNIRAIALLIGALLIPAASGQGPPVTPVTARCGSLVFLRCLAGENAQRPDTALGVEMDQERWAFGIDLDEIVVTGRHVRRETMAQVFERNLRAPGRSSSAMSTRDVGNGMKCTSAVGPMYCSRSANERPDPAGTRLDWSNWVF